MSTIVISLHQRHSQHVVNIILFVTGKVTGILW